MQLMCIHYASSQRRNTFESFSLTLRKRISLSKWWEKSIFGVCRRVMSDPSALLPSLPPPRPSAPVYPDLLPPQQCCLSREEICTRFRKGNVRNFERKRTRVTETAKRFSRKINKVLDPSQFRQFLLSINNLTNISRLLYWIKEIR